MARVYEVNPDGTKTLITTVDDLPGIDEEVQLLIEDIDTAPLSYNEGKRYIYGGNSNDDKWICVRGLKCWYSKKALEILQSPTDNGFVRGITGSGYLTWSNTLLSNDIKDNLYNSFTIRIGDRDYDFYLTMEANGADMIVSLRVKPVNVNLQTFTDKKFQLNENFKYLGMLPVVSEINSANKTVTLQIAFVVLAEDGTPIIFQTKDSSTSGTWRDTGYQYTNGMYFNLANQTLQGHYTVSFANDYEYYYALGLTDIYEKKTMTDVINILENNNG